MAWKFPDARGWIGIGVFAISTMLIWMMHNSRELREDEFFQTIATVVIANGLMAVIAWAYSATKQGGELAEKNANIVHENATASTAATTTLAAATAAALPTPGAPLPVIVENPPEKPANVTDAGAAHDDELPEYAR